MFVFAGNPDIILTE